MEARTWEFRDGQSSEFRIFFAGWEKILKMGKFSEKKKNPEKNLEFLMHTIRISTKQNVAKVSKSE